MSVLAHEDIEHSASEDDYESSTSEQKFLLEEIKSSLINNTKSDTEGQVSFLSRIRNWNWKNIAFAISLWIFFFLCNAGISVMGSFFSEEAEKKKVAPIITSVIIFSSPLLEVLLSPFFGYLLPQIGILFAIFLGLLMTGGSLIALAFVVLIPSPIAFIVISVLLRISQGVGSSLFIIAGFATFPDLFPGNLATVVAIMGVAIGCGFTVGPIFGGLLYELGGFLLPFLTMGVTIVVLTLFCCILIRVIRLGETKPPSLPLKTIFSISTDLVFIALAISASLGMASLSFFTPTLEPFLKQELHLNNSRITGVFVIGAIAYMITALIIGPLLDKFGKHRYYIISGGVVSTVGYILMGCITYIGNWSVFLVCVFYFFVGIGAGLSTIPVYADLLKVAQGYMKKGDDRLAKSSFVAGVNIGCAYTGQFAGALIGGLLTHFTSFYLSATIVGELMLAETLFLVGVTVISKYKEWSISDKKT